MKYNKVSKEIILQLIDICGDNNVIRDDMEKLEPYSHDEVSDEHYKKFPEVVVKPVTAAEVSAIMKTAYENMIPVTPRGAGSGLSGGAVPEFGGIVMSFEKMNKIIEVDKKNMMIRVQPGVVTNEINHLLKDDGLYYAGYPMSLETCFIGGNVAENAGGEKAVKYGVTSRYVYGLEAVLPNGELIHLGGKRVKDVTGYNLLQLLTGSEGTLAVFTEITLKLSPLPQYSADLFVLFPEVGPAIDSVPKLMTDSGIIPTVIEFMDEQSVRTACGYINEKLDLKNCGAVLLITVDGYDQEQVERDYEKIGKLCESYGAIEVYVADNVTTSERIWKIRRNVAEAFKIDSPTQSLEDIVVPFASIPEAVPAFKKIADKYNVFIPCYGHAGDGNIHATVVKKNEMAMEEWEKNLDEILKEIYQVTIDLGGSISGEHGIGNKRKKYLSMGLSQEEILLMKRIKAAFDPKEILNPGKIFPD